MRAHQAHYPVATQCRLLGVSTSGYYAWQRRGTSARAEADRELLSMIQAIHAGSHGTYGAPRIHAELGARGVRVGRKRVARLMRSVALAGVSRRKRPHTTVRSRGTAKAPDLVQRQFTAEAPDRLWVADITYVPTGAGFLYLAVVVDVFSRRVVGWAMESHIRTELVLQALNMALYLRRPQGVIHHSYQGIQSQPMTSASGAVSGVSGRLWGLWAIAMTMPYARASLPRWSVNSWTAGPSRPTPRRAWPYSITSRAGTTPTVVILPSATMPQLPLRGVYF